VAQKEMMDMGLRGVPAFIIGDEVIVGLDTVRIEAALDYKVEKCPYCEQKMRIPKGKGKIRIKCSNCEKKFETRT
jgi:tRNA(Ile2) C34 agmatinyltransferase TiaS